MRTKKDLLIENDRLHAENLILRSQLDDLPHCKYTAHTPIINRLIAVWNNHPHLRLLQLLHNAGCLKSGVSEDGFYLTDEKLVDMLEAFTKKDE